MQESLHLFPGPRGMQGCVLPTPPFLLSPIPYEELVRLIDEASEKNLSVSILTQVRGYTTAGNELWQAAVG